MKDAKEGESGAEEAKAGTESESEAKGEPKKKEPKCPMSFLNFFFLIHASGSPAERSAPSLGSFSAYLLI